MVNGLLNVSLVDGAAPEMWQINQPTRAFMQTLVAVKGAPFPSAAQGRAAKS